MSTCVPLCQPGSLSTSLSVVFPVKYRRFFTGELPTRSCEAVLGAALLLQRFKFEFQGVWIGAGAAQATLGKFDLSGWKFLTKWTILGEEVGR